MVVQFWQPCQTVPLVLSLPVRQPLVWFGVVCLSTWLAWADWKVFQSKMAGVARAGQEGKSTG